MIEREPGANWRDLQHRVAAILNECGLEAEVSKEIRLARGASEIDVFAIDMAATPNSIYLCECKRWHASVPQAEVQAFLSIVANAGAHVGLFISANGFQSGAYEVAKHTNVHLLSWTEFQETFVERWCANFWVPAFREKCDRLVGYVDPLSSDAWHRFEAGEAVEPAEAIGMMAQKMWSDPFKPLRDRRPGQPLAPAIWALRASFERVLPERIAQTQFLRELLDDAVSFCNQWTLAREADPEVRERRERNQRMMDEMLKELRRQQTDD
jgi:hypothetical protein